MMACLHGFRMMDRYLEPFLVTSGVKHTRHAKRQPFPFMLPVKAHKNQVARQDPRHRGPEESGNAKRAYSVDACTA